MIKNLKVKKKIVNFKNGNLEKEKKDGSRLKALLFSFLISIMFFFILIGLEASILRNYEKIQVVVAKEMLVDGTEITKENVDTYFRVKDVDVALKTDSAITSVEKLPGYIVRDTIEENEIISSYELIKKDSTIETLILPIEVSFKVSDISQVVGGTLRPGDLIDISVVNNDSKKSERILGNVFVTQVFSSSGAKIEKVDITSSAVTINILISKENENEFNEKISKGIVRVSKTNGIS